MKARCFLIACLLIASWILDRNLAQAETTNAGPQILFVRLKFAADQSLNVVETITRPGELKPPLHTDTTGGLHYELQDAAGKLLWHAMMSDPRELSAAQTEAARARKSALLVTGKREAEFMVRVPVRTNAVQLEFYQWTAGATNQPPERIRLGLFPLPRP